MGIDSRSLWGPDEGREVKTPPSLSSIHVLGADSRFMCFLGPRTILNRDQDELELEEEGKKGIKLVI